jgi:flagellum-specific ATP synthase
MSPFAPYRQILRTLQPVGIAGRVRAVRGLTVGVADFSAPVGAGCRIFRGPRGIEARVIGFAGDETLVMPLGDVTGISRGDRVVCSVNEQTVAVSPAMLGRVLDGFGRPIDGKGEIRIDRRMPIWPEPMGPMLRRRIDQPLATGVRAVDAMLTIGRGQRMGIFSGSGVGKSVLLGMISRYTAADVTVIGMIGERGREVRDFIEKDLGPEGLRRAVVVACTSDQPPLLRVQSGAVAMALAEYFRDQGRDVLLLIDSLNRLATAQRQIGLAAGEPPATKGYTPSVFNLLPQLVERAGRSQSGSITAFYAVLVEGDDMSDPIADAARAVTDGHVSLSRKLANRGHFPAVDVLLSVSRVMIDVADDAHLAAARTVQSLLAVYDEVEDMVNIGAYQKGASAEYDLAIRMMPAVRKFLAQHMDQAAPFDRTRKALLELAEQIRRAEQPAGPTARAASRSAWR